MYDFLIGSENSKSLSFASKRIPCDLYIPEKKVRIVTIARNIVSIMYVKLTLCNGSASM